ncbi:MAG TPA: hypothetical protein VN788_14410 [Verrucomicrobiae bacterium]|nr:hypothetical protein [Verrucomicrobiae bacterium]
MLLLIGVTYGAFWWAGKVPRRPKQVAANAVFLWAPSVGLSAPKRGWWLSCTEDAGQNRCTLSDIKGNTEYEGEFLSSNGKGPVPADQLKIDTRRTLDDKVWAGSVLVPLVFLENGTILIPASKYQEGMHLLKQAQPNH